MRDVDPLVSNLSGKVARTNPLEGGPEFEAMFQDGIISTTKSHHLSILMDKGDHDVHEALSLLGWTMDDIREPGIFLPDERAFYRMRHEFEDRIIEQEQDNLRVEVRRHQGIIDVVMTGFVVEDQDDADMRADQKQEEIKKAEEEYMGPSEYRYAKNDEEIEVWLKHGNEQAILCMARDALRSGVWITGDEFARIMLEGTNVLQPEYPSELAKTWISAVNYTIEDAWRDAVLPEITVGEMVLGRAAYEGMKRSVDNTYARAKEIADGKWALIKPAFLVQRFDESPLITGSNKSEETTAWIAGRVATSNNKSAANSIS